MKLLQRIAYLNIQIHPFTSIFLIVYCLLPAVCLLSGQFIVPSFTITSLIYLSIITSTSCLHTMLEIKWSGINIEQWWKKQQFWLITATSSHFIALPIALFKLISGIHTSFDIASEPSGLYIMKWISLMILPITIILTNMVAITTAVFQAVNSPIQQWTQLIGGVSLSCLVLVHFYPFVKGLVMTQRGKTPTIVYIWSGLIVSCIVALLWLVSADSGQNIDGFHF